MSNAIHIPCGVYQKLLSYAQIADEDDAEIGGYLVISELPEVGITIEDVILPTQKVSGGSVEVTPGGDWMKTLTAEQLPKLKGWWHSHRHMGTFHSNTDDNTLGDKFDGETAGSMNYAVSIVVSLPSELKARLQYFKPIKTTPIEVPVDIIHPKSKEIFDKCVEEVKDRVSREWSYNVSKCKYLKTEKKDFTVNPTIGASAQENLATGEANIGNKSGIVKLGNFFREDYEEDEWKIAEEIIDVITGLSIAALIDNGQYDPELYPELEKEYQAKLKKTKLRAFKGRCPHMFLNQQMRSICFFTGKTFDCKSCKHLPKPSSSIRTKSKKVSQSCDKSIVAVQKEDLNTPSNMTSSSKTIVIDD